MTDPLGRVTLADCPPGPFLFEGTLGFKTEYRAMMRAPSSCRTPAEVRFMTTCWPDAYCMATGEAFWGGTTRHRDRAKLLVLPIVLSEDAVRSARSGVMLYRGPGTICPDCFSASWLVGRRSAQCGGCGTALDLATPQAAQVHP
ncbi:hypothetical protein [Sphingomonas sp. 1185]|uniref:hypothetical protein n=1 Tax=Sphingomonas sp. 1185 TaxID=3156411 RepID=UPI003393CACF